MTAVCYTAVFSVVTQRSSPRGEERFEVEKVFVQGSVQGNIVWNHLWEHRFSVPDPRVFPPPEDRIYNWAVITETMFQTLVFTKTTGRQPGWGHCYLRSSQLHLACELACLRLRDSRDGWIEQSANTKIKGKETEESRGDGSRLKNSRVFFLKISNEIGKAWRKSVTRAKRASLTRLKGVPGLLFDCSPVLSYEQIENSTKDSEVRWDLGNRAGGRFRVRNSGVREEKIGVSLNLWNNV